MMISEGKTESMRDRIRQRAKERQANQGGLSTLTLPEGVDLYKPEKGSVEFDILLYRISVDNHPDVKKGDLWYRRTFLQHSNIGPEEKRLVCPRTVGKRCPICEEHQRLKKDPNAEEKVVDALRAKERELFNVVMKDGDGSVMILDVSIHNFGKLLEKEINEGEESNAAFPDFSGGKTLRVRWSMKTMGTGKPFPVADRIDFIDREDIDESALDAVVDLDKAMKILSYEEIEKIFQAGGDEAEEDHSPETDDAQVEVTPARRVIGKVKPAPEVEEENEEEDELPGLEKKKTGERETPDCIACDGTGKTSKGKTCPICGGSGKDGDVPADDAKDDADKEEQEEEVKPAKRVIGKPAVKEEAPAGRRVIRRG